MNGHTKGPWRLVNPPEEGGDYAVYGNDGVCVALSVGGTSAEHANAILIAAAPIFWMRLRLQCSKSVEKASILIIFALQPLPKPEVKNDPRHPSPHSRRVLP